MNKLFLSTARTSANRGSAIWRHAGVRLADATGATPIWSTTRAYRGQAQDHPPTTLSAKEEQLLKVAQPKSDAIRERHLRLPDVAEIPKASLMMDDNDDDTSNNTKATNLDIRRKRLLYRSKQRGWLEVDLLLGTWAHQHLHALTAAELDEYERFVNCETIDIYNVITLRIDVPDDMKSKPGGQSSVVERIQAWARASPLGQADPEKYKEVKTANKLI